MESFIITQWAIVWDSSITATPSLRMTQKQIILKIYFILLNKLILRFFDFAHNGTETNNTILIKTLVIVFAYNCSATTYPPETLPSSGVPNALANVLGYKWEQNEM